MRKAHKSRLSKRKYVNQGLYSNRQICKCQAIYPTGETHLNYLLDKKENRPKFVIIFLGVVGWVERHSVNNRQS